MTDINSFSRLFGSSIVQALAIVALLSSIALEAASIWKGSNEATVTQMQARYADLKQKAEAEEAAYKAEIEKATAANAEVQQKAEADLAAAKARIAQAKAPYQSRLAKARAALTDAQAQYESYQAEIKRILGKDP